MTHSKTQNLGKRLRTFLLIVVALVGGWYLRAGLAPVQTATTTEDASSSALPNAAQEAESSTVWSCSMHPQIQLSEFGPCPLCGMDLIPIERSANSDESEAERQIKLSATDRARIRIQSEPVERRFVEADIRLFGKVQVDESRLASLTAWAPGRLDRLFVDYTGVEVAAGEHMVSLYSPKIYTDQTALLSALDAQRSLPLNVINAESTAVSATVDAARERLRQVGLSAEQLKEIEERGTPSDHITINAPIGGVVVHKNGRPGMYVEEGTRIYTIADLSRLWLLLDAYESDLAWLHYGQVVEFTAEAYPGEVFVGTISFISRELDPKTQTVKVRVNLDNSEGRLKPGMFARAVVRTKVATRGRVMDRSLTGKWICSMHPEIVRSEFGHCDLCEMDLVTTESLGYVPANPDDQEMPLVIPVTAALRTGRRAIVYLELETEDGPVYEGREIMLGPRAGDWYLVESGLQEGDRVVTNGNFKLDSALQILAKPSMMSDTDHNHEHEGEDELRHDVRINRDFLRAEDLTVDQVRFRAELLEMRSAYFEVHFSLFTDDHASAKLWATMGAASVKRTRTIIPSIEAREAWNQLEPDLIESFEAIGDSIDVARARTEFVRLSSVMRSLLKEFDLDAKTYEAECPMAFDDGARWLQSSDAVQNPYFDGYMKACGTVLGELSDLNDSDE